MADRKSGPVKPPVIDLTARDATRPGNAGGANPVERGAPAKSSGKPKARPAAAAESGPVPAAEAVAGQAAAPEAKAAPQAEPAAARPAQASTPQPKPAAEAEKPARSPKPAEPPRPTPQAAVPPPPRPQPRLAMPWSAISIAAIGGAVLGVGLTYLLASWISLPNSLPAIADPAPLLAEHEGRVGALESRFTALEATAGDIGGRLGTTTTALEDGLAELRRSIAAVQAAIPSGEVDLSGIESELRALQGRMEAVAAGASSADADALAQSLMRIERSLAATTTRIGQLDQQAAAAGKAIEAVSADLGALKTAVAARNQSIGGADIGPAVKLPLVLSGLEAAFAAGRPYAAELRSLTNILPDLVVPGPVRAAAETGLARPDDLANRFSAALPDILGGRTAAPTGDWTSNALEWAKALLALRPAGEVEGDTPEAVISRLEAAVERRDFVAADALLSRLPGPMHAAAGPLAGEIAAHAEAAQFIAALRAQALAPVAEADP